MATSFPLTVYIRRTDTNRLQVLAGVHSFMRSKWWQCTDTYQDNGWDVGRVPMVSGGTGTLVAADIPVVGVEDTAITYNSFGSIKFASADKHHHIPPRPKWEIRTGYLFALESNIVLPTLTTWRQKSVSVSTSTDVLTASSHGFRSGDLVMADYTTQPSPVARSGLYAVVYLTDSTFKLRDVATGAYVNFSAAGSDVTISLVDPAPVTLLIASGGLVAVPDSVRPLISTTNPDA